jgi:hypothetical protein
MDEVLFALDSDLIIFVAIVGAELGLPLSLIKCFRHNSFRCAAIKHPGIEQIVRQTTPSNFFREPFSISIISPLFGCSMSTDAGITAIDKRRFGFGIEFLVIMSNVNGGELGRRRLRVDEITD